MEDLGLDPRILAAAKELGIEAFTEPQLRAIPPILAGKHVLLVAPTGIGKTEAAILPIFHRLLREDPKRIAALYITPLRALNRDMLRRMTFFAERLGLDVAVRHGDTPPQDRARLTRKPPQLLITTPETFQILFTGEKLREQLRHVRWVVIDEIHELANDDRGSQLVVGLERLATIAGEFQRVGLSATVGSPEEVASFLGGVRRTVETICVRIPKGIRIAVEWPEPAPGDEDLAQRLHVAREQATILRRCRELIRQHRSTLLFTNTRDTAEFLASRLRLISDEPAIGVHHGSLSKDVRIQMEDDFKAERLKALICTSSLELGIDVGSADFVLQYNSPREVTRLVQRIGRSGHGVGEVSDGAVLSMSEDDLAEASVIARRALAEELEPLAVREDNFAVLANQLAAMAMSAQSVGIDEAYDLVRGSHPFRNLKRVDYEALVAQLAELRILWVRDGRFGRSRGTMTYFFENISMIPDVKTYRVVDISSRRAIGTLDEWFVAENAKLGATFVIKGSAWRFVEFRDDGQILVEPVKDLGEIPSWIGEEIPVPFAVATEVGALRRTLNFDPYPARAHGAERVRAYVRGQGEMPVPSDTLITIESAKDVIVVNACFGTRVNETLGQLIASLLGARLGESVGLQTDPYRVVLQVPRAVKPDQILEYLKPEDPDALEPLLRVVLKNSNFLRWAFVHVAKKFGAIRRDVDWESINLGRLLKTFENTPLFEEVLGKVFWERMDVENAANVLRGIRDGTIKVHLGRLSPIGRVGLERNRHLVMPARADKATLQALKNRLDGEPVLLLCMNCRAASRSVVRELRAKVTCPQCSAKMLAILRPYEREMAALLEKAHLSKGERAELKRLYTNASLVAAHGKKAVYALVSRGVGPDTAARILRNLHEDEDAFLRDLLAAEVNYARTRRFWD
ncbi:MAG TPA: DEAD/DEAH box helicase [Thermoplasmata archaeon]|nr:DEAD/DEAH box helicase [Thermoplasmata archaeon]